MIHKLYDTESKKPAITAKFRIFDCQNFKSQKTHKTLVNANNYAVNLILHATFNAASHASVKTLIKRDESSTKVTQVV